MEPVPGSRPNPCLPPDTDHGRSLAGNVYDALVGLYWLENDFQGFTNIFVIFMVLGQIEYVCPMVSPCQEELHRVPAGCLRRQVPEVRVRLLRAWLWQLQREAQLLSGSSGGAQAAVHLGSRK